MVWFLVLIGFLDNSTNTLLKRPPGKIIDKRAVHQCGREHEKETYCFLEIFPFKSVEMPLCAQVWRGMGGARCGEARALMRLNKGKISGRIDGEK